MKPFLAASVVCNVALAAVVVWLVQRPSSKAPQQSDPAVAAAAHPGATRSNTAAAPAPVVASAESPKAPQLFDWRMVESEDYKKYIANLRAVGCPEETIRDIITADVNKLFESRRREITASKKKFEYWKSGNIFGDFMDPDRMEKAQELAKEKRALLKELLGVEPEEKPDIFSGVNPFEAMLDFLSPTQQNQVMEVYMKYQAKIAKSIRGGSMDAGDMKAMQKVQKEMEAELASMMSPKEFEDYQLRMSQTAMMMRMQMGSFDATEQEFRDIFKARKAFDDEYGMMGAAGASKEERDKMKAAQDDMKEKLKEVLGEKRAAEYERSQDYAYQGIYRVVERNGLSKEVANQVFDMKKVAEDEAKKVRADSSLTSEQRQETLKKIRAETENAMKTVMGTKAFESYQTQPGAYWVRSISPDPK